MLGFLLAQGEFEQIGFFLKRIDLLLRLGQLARIDGSGLSGERFFKFGLEDHAIGLQLPHLVP